MKPRRVVAKVEWHPGVLYLRVGVIVSNMARPAGLDWPEAAPYPQPFAQQLVNG
jgi:hypothetical protein